MGIGEDIYQVAERAGGMDLDERLVTRLLEDKMYGTGFVMVSNNYTNESSVFKLV